LTAEQLIERWRALRAARAGGEDQILSTPVVREGVDTALQLAVDARGHLHLLAPVVGPPTRPLPPDFNGLRLRDGRLGDELCLDLSSPAAHETMFAALCGQVIEAIAGEGREPWAASITIVRGWQSAWKPVRQPMSRTTQIGLAGELLMLRALWNPALGPDAVHFWTGPDPERHDFSSPRLHMEVKTTARSRHEHEISRVDQLQAPEGRRLLFASVQIEESSAGAQSLASLVDAVIEDIGRDPAALDVFLTSLNRLDWSDEMRRSPELLRFHLRDAQIFEVDDEFPRLPEDFALPQGVLAVRYTISLANLPFLDSDSVRADIAR